MKKKTLSILLLIAAVLLCWLLFCRVSAEELQAAISLFGPLAPFAYMAAFALLPAFFFPVAVLALAGGLLFGLWLGSLYTFIGAMLNCALMFWLSRHAGRKQVERLVQEKLSDVWQRRLARAGGQRGFMLLIILRLIPAVPYNLINYAFGLTNMPFGAYLLGSAIGIIPGTLVFINMGDKALEPGSASFYLAIGLLILLLAVTSYAGKRLLQKTNDDGENTKHEKEK